MCAAWACALQDLCSCVCARGMYLRRLGAAHRNGATDGGQWERHDAAVLPLTDVHYECVQHSRVNRRVWRPLTTRAAVLQQVAERRIAEEADLERWLSDPAMAEAATGMAPSVAAAEAAVAPAPAASLRAPAARQNGPAPVVRQSKPGWFGAAIRPWVDAAGGACELSFDAPLLAAMDPHVEKARQRRAEALAALVPGGRGWAAAPAPLRVERKCRYDGRRWRLREEFAAALHVAPEALSSLHTLAGAKSELLCGLLDRARRAAFHECYDRFCRTVAAPRLALAAAAAGVRVPRGREVRVRYQAFPCVRVLRPGEFSLGPHCDQAYGHARANINWLVPLTAARGSSALYVERAPGREDWHALAVSEAEAAAGCVFVFDGANCVHFTAENASEETRVSLDFRLALFEADDDEDGATAAAASSPAGAAGGGCQLPSEVEIQDRLGADDAARPDEAYYAVCRAPRESLVLARLRGERPVRADVAQALHECGEEGEIETWGGEKEEVEEWVRLGPLPQPTYRTGFPFGQ